MRELVRTEIVEDVELNELVSRLDEDSSDRFDQPRYRSDQESVLLYEIEIDREEKNALGTIQLEIYLDNKVRAIGDRFLVQDYFAEACYETSWKD